MKSLLHTALAVLLLTGFTACEGSSDNNDDNGNGGGETPTEGYTLSINKNEIEADGKDAVTFTLKDANGTILTEGLTMNYVVFTEVGSGNQLEKKTKTFTAIKNGTYTFKALYKSYESENTVTITAKNRNKYEKYFRKVAAYDITNVFCTYCPLMASALEKAPATWKQHMTVFAIHGPFDNKDPYIIGNVANNLLSRFVGTGSYPSCIFNLDYTMTGAGDAKPEFIAGVIESQMRKFPATCGIRINSKYENKTITVDAAITSNVGGKYDLGYAVMVDDQVFVGGVDTNNIYNDIVMAISGNYMTMNSQSTMTLEADAEQTKTFTLEDVNISDTNLPNYRIVVFALRPNGTGSIIDNIAECHLGESVDYVLNE